MPTLEIHDVTYTKRRVRFPDACPKCKASFHDSEDNLRQFFKAESSQRCRLVPKRMGRGFDTEGDCNDLRGTDTEMPTVAYGCAACGAVIREGREEWR